MQSKRIFSLSRGEGQGELKFQLAWVEEGAEVSAQTEILHVISSLVVKPSKAR